MSFWGLEKIREDWPWGLVRDHGGHLARGFAIVAPAAFTVELHAWAAALVGTAAGLLREVEQVLRDKTPNANLVDRILDVAFHAAGSLAAWALAATF